MALLEVGRRTKGRDTAVGSDISKDLTSEFSVGIEGAPGQTAAQVLSSFDVAMEQLKTRTLSQQAVNAAVYEMLVSQVTLADGAAFRAEHYARYQSQVGTPWYLRHDIERYQRISPQDVRDAIAKWMPRDRRVVVFVTPNGGTKGGGERTGRRFTPAGVALPETSTP